MTEHILVIKHGALGDIILATAGFKAIREARPNAHIVLLTTKPYAELLAQSPYFNEIWVDSKPKLRDRKAIGRLRAMLNSYAWSWVYDLQASGRSTLYQWLLKRPWPNINNASRFASHTRPPFDKSKHAIDNLRTQLSAAGLVVNDPDISWLKADISQLKPSSPYALFVPGGAPHRPAKRWPADQFAALAQELADKKITPVLLGTRAEQEVLDSIAARVPQAINLGGRTSIAELSELARGASFAVGNDTGPMHMIAATGIPCVALFSHDSDPTRCAPVGKVTVLRESNLADLSVDAALSALRGFVPALF